MFRNKKDKIRGVGKGILSFLLVLFLLAGFLILLMPNSANADDSTLMNWAGHLDPFAGSAKVAGKITGANPFADAGNLVSNMFVSGFKQLLYGIFLLFAFLLGLAATLFGWIVDPGNMDFIFRNAALYESWKTVRDLLNLAFILVLLYSAFCTVFQIEKYHLKKILLMLVLMALLVNFSFPVSRLIIDFSNVTMYFLMGSNENGAGMFAKFAESSGISEILTPKGNVDSASFSYLFAIITFTFILMVTLLVVAVMFVIRMIVLAVLIIFSPVGFVASIFPSTKHYADDWWKNLFKYALFFPSASFFNFTAQSSRIALCFSSYPPYTQAGCQTTANFFSFNKGYPAIFILFHNLAKN